MLTDLIRPYICIFIAQCWIKNELDQVIVIGRCLTGESATIGVGVEYGVACQLMTFMVLILQDKCLIRLNLQFGEMLFNCTFNWYLFVLCPFYCLIYTKWTLCGISCCRCNLDIIGHSETSSFDTRSARIKVSTDISHILLRIRCYWIIIILHILILLFLVQIVLQLHSRALVGENNDLIINLFHWDLSYMLKTNLIWMLTKIIHRIPSINLIISI